MPNLTIIQLSVEELKELIKNATMEVIAPLLETKKQVNDNEGKDELMKIKDLSKYLRVSEVTIHQWKKIGLIPFYRISNKVYFKKNEVIEALRKANNNQPKY